MYQQFHLMYYFRQNH